MWNGSRWVWIGSLQSSKIRNLLFRFLQRSCLLRSFASIRIVTGLDGTDGTDPYETHIKSIWNCYFEVEDFDYHRYAENMKIHNSFKVQMMWTQTTDVPTRTIELGELIKCINVENTDG